MGRIITPTPDWQAQLDSEPIMYNTGFTLWQRGASINASPSRNYAPLADGFAYYQDPAISDLAISFSRLTGVEVSTKPSPSNALRATVTTAHPTVQSFSTSSISQGFEAYYSQLMYEFPFTIAFSVRSSVPGVYSICCRQRDNTGTVINSCSKTYTIYNANTWERKIVRFPKPPTVAMSLRASGSQFAFNFMWSFCVGAAYAAPQDDVWVSGDYRASANQINMTATAGATFDITAVALQLGHQEPVWRPEPFDFTLQRARRYFQKSYDLDTAPGTATTAGMVRSALTQLPSATRWHAIQVKLSPPMRAIPTVTIYSPPTGAPGKLRDFATLTDLVANVRDVSNVQFHVDALTTVASPGIDFRFHYTAEA